MINRMTLAILTMTSLLIGGCKAFHGDKVHVSTKVIKQKELSATLSSVNVSNNQVTLHGTGFLDVSTVKIQGHGVNTTLVVNSKSDTQIIAKASSALSLLVNRTFNLIIENVEAQAVYPITFTLQNGAVLASHLDQMSASIGQVLKWNGSTWAPASLASSQVYRGGWNANTNSPALSDSTASASGEYYIVTTAGTQDLGSGSVSYLVGDWVMSNGTSWDLIVGSLSGSGTTNYFPYYSSSSTLSNSPMYLSGSNIGIGTTTPGSALDIKGTLRLSGATSGYVGFSPAAVAGSTIYTLPAADGSNGQVLSTNASGVLSWRTIAVTGGTVTDVTSANADIGIATGTSTPVLTLNAGTGANQIVKLTAASKLPAVDGSLLTSLDPSNLSAAVAVNKGGTGLSAGTTGGIPYFSSTTSIASTAGGLADEVFRVPGGGGAPSFGAIDLTKSAAVTGALPIANGGTGATSLGAAQSALGIVLGGSTSGTTAMVGTGGVQADKFCLGDSSGGGISCSSATSLLLAGSISDESGTGALLFGTSPTISNPNITGVLKLSGSTSGHVSFVPAAAAGATTYLLPATQGTAGQVLSTDGVATTPTLSWITPATTSTSLSGDIGGTIGANTIGANKVTSTHISDGSIVNADVSASAAIDATKINTGVVSNAEFNYLDGVTSAIQTQLDGKQSSITAGTTSQYYRGDKTFVDLATDVRGTALTGLSSATGNIASTDTVSQAFGKLLNTQTDYVSKTANSTITGTLTINTIVGALTVPLPVNYNDAANKGYVDSYGQWTKSGNDIYRSTGSVGVGVSPIEKLEVAGNFKSGQAPSTLTTVNGAHLSSDTTINVASTTGYPSSGTLLINSEAMTYTGLTSTSFTGVTRAALGTSAAALSNAQSVDIYLNTVTAASSTTPKMVVMGSGKVGIGMAAPGQKFLVNGTIASPYSSGFGTTSLDGNTVLNRFTQNNLSTTFYNYEASGYTFNNTNSTLLRVDNSGNVGIGTVAPSNKLSVTPSQYTTGNASQSGNTVTGSGTTWTSAMVGSQLVFANGTSAGTITAFGSTTSLTVSTSQTINSQNYIISYPGLQVSSTGNVSIGTMTSNGALTISGDARLIGANSIYFGPTGSTGGSIGVTDPAWGPLYLSSSNGVVISNNLRMQSSNILSNEDLTVGPNNNNRVLTLRSSGTGNILLSPGGTEKVRIDSDGSMGIGTTPSYKLHVVGSSGATVGYFSDGSASCSITPSTLGSVSCSSDERLKKNIEFFSDLTSLERILKLQTVTYEWKNIHNGRHTGYIAQQVEKVAPELVTESKDGYKQVSYSGFIPWITGSIKALYVRAVALQDQVKGIVDRLFYLEEKDKDKDREIASLKIENETLKKDNDVMKSRLDKIEAMLLAKKK